MAVDLLQAPDQQAQQQAQSRPQAPASEQQAAQSAFQSHVGRQAFLKDKPIDYNAALDLYKSNYSQGQNQGDAINHAISAMKWDDPSAWGPTSTGPTDTGPKVNPWADLWGTTGKNPQSFVSAYIAQKGLHGAQANPAALNDIVGTLQSLGVNAQLDSDAPHPGFHKGIMLNGQFVKMLDGRDNWIWEVGGDGGGGGGPDTSIPGSNVPMQSNTFTDPSTLYYQQLLQERAAQLGQGVNDPTRQALANLIAQQSQMMQAQQAEQQRQNELLRQRMVQAQAQTDKFVSYANERAGKLQQPAYTGAEGEVMRTQALDPIEADRQAALHRALDNIGSRGFDPSSGIAQELMLQVNQGADRARNTAQGNLAYAQIQEQRSREQEAQQLLGMIPQAQMAAAQGDLGFLQQLDQASNKLGAGAGSYLTQGAALNQQVRDEQNARANQLLGIGSQLYQLPTNAAQGAMAALGQAPNPADLTAQTIQLAQLANQQNQQGASFWGQLGTSFAPFFR